MNAWDSNRNRCDIPEEVYEDITDQPLKSFFRLNVKRLRCSDNMEMRLPPSAVARGRKRKLDMDWIRCCNPKCGKWRAISTRGITATQILSKLNKGRHWVDQKPLLWYCSMNNWDETKASCSAPQEILYDAPWNLHHSSSSISGVLDNSLLADK